MASRGRWRTPQRGRAAERTGTPRHAGATAFRQYRNMRGKPERANNRAPEKPANLGHKPLAARFPHRYAQTCPPGYPQGSAEKTARLAEKLSKEASEINGLKVVKFTNSVDPALIKGVAGLLQKQSENFVFAAAFEYAEKPNLVLMYSPDLVAKGKNAGKDIREAAKFILGGGGGQPGLATAGGKNVAGLKDALDKLVEIATA